MSRTRSKICGITSVEAGLWAAGAGADAIGLVFFAGSKRAINISTARDISQAMPAFICCTGLFVNPERAEVETVLAGVRLDLLQFHGEESPEFCNSFGVPYMKAIRVKPGLDVLAELARYPEATAIMLDAWHPQEAGGTGQKFDWSVASTVVSATDCNIVLAGGLDAGNVASAIQQVRPYAVDVSSGVEKAPGIKDSGKISAFMQEVYRVQS